MSTFLSFLLEPGLTLIIGLTPEVKYPTQYLQGIQALRHILKLGYQPGDVIISGASLHEKQAKMPRLS